MAQNNNLTPEQRRKLVEKQNAEAMDKILAPDEMMEGSQAQQQDNKKAPDRDIKKAIEDFKKRFEKKETPEDGKPEEKTPDGEAPETTDAEKAEGEEGAEQPEGETPEGETPEPESGEPKEPSEPGAEPEAESKTGAEKAEGTEDLAKEPKLGEEPSVPSETPGAEAGEKVGEAATKEGVEKGAEAGVKAGTTGATGTAGEGVAGATGAIGGTAAAGGEAVAAGGTAAAAEGGVLATLLAPEIIIPLIIIFALLIIIVILAIAIIGFFTSGGGGASLAQPYNPNNADHKELLTSVVDMAKKKNSKTGMPTLDMPDKELDFLQNGYDRGAGQDKLYVDIRVLKTLKYLGEKHEYIKVDHIIYPYVLMKADTIETKSTVSKTAIKNQSAHKQGKAVDISAIDVIYSQCTACCSTGCDNNLKNNYWIKESSSSRSCSLLCTDGCTCSKGRTCAANMSRCSKTNCTTIIPIQIDWQDEADGDFDFRGINSNNAKNKILEDLGIDPNLANGKDFKEVAASIGQGELENYFGMENGSLSARNLPDLLEEMGLYEYWDKTGLPRGSFEADTVEEAIKDTGQAKLEEVLNLPNESLNGDNINSWAISSAKVKLAKELGIEYSDLNSPETFRNKMIERQFSDEDLKTIARYSGATEDILILYKNGNSAALRDYGVRILENAFGVRADTIKNYIYGIENRILWPEDIQKKIETIETYRNLAEGQFTNLMTVLNNNGSLNNLAYDWGSKEVSKALGIEEHKIRDWASGSVKIDDIILQEGQDWLDLSYQYQIDEMALKKILGAKETGFSIQDGMMIVGSDELSKYYYMDRDVLVKYAKQQIPYSEFISESGIDYESLASKYGYNVDFYENFFKNKIEESYANAGGEYLKYVLNLEDNQIKELIANNNPAVLAQNEIIKAIADSEGIAANQIANVFVGDYSPASLTGIGSSLNFGSFLGQGFGLLASNCQGKYRDAARNKVHKVIKQLLEYPADQGSVIANRISQIMTYSQERDVTPFEEGTEKPTLDEVYGEGRLPNYGLFSMTDGAGNPYLPLKNNIHWGF